MALPSAVTLGSLALVVAAGAGLGVITASSGQEDQAAALRLLGQLVVGIAELRVLEARPG